MMPPAFDKLFKTVAVLAALCACLLFSAAPAQAQASFVESFDNVGPTNSGQDGPQNLISRGWIFRNQSSPKGTTSWHNGYTPDVQSFWPSPQAGAGYVAVESTSADQFGGKVSNWSILPQVSGQRVGDTLTFYVLNMDSHNTPTLQVRYSPGGGTSTGSGADAVGDFTQVLLDINPLPVSGWNRYSVTLPGSGRIALRYYIAQACNWGCASAYTGVDTLSVGAAPAAGCNLPPVPNAGQTVTWTAARSPYQVCQNIGIPPGSTVNVEAGVKVNFDSQRQLVVNGTLNLQGTATARVSFNSTAVYPPIVDAINGTVNATFADFGGQFYVETGSNVTLSDCLFAGLGYLRSQDIPAVSPFVKLDRCTFDHAGMTLARALVRLRNNTFNNSYALIVGGFADVTAPNTFVGQPLQIDREGVSYAQGLYVDGVNASGVVDGGGLQLSGGNYLLGPTNVLQSNLFSLRLEGGLIPGSKVPTTGNTNNVIDVNTGGFAAISGRWPNFGIPYRITQLSGDLPGGNLTIDPGVTVEADPGTWFLFRSTRRLIADGLPDQPITFKGTVPGQLWKGLTFATNSTEGPRLEYCRVSDAEFGTVSTDNLLYVHNCDFQNNRVGSNANTFGWTIFAKTRFLTNSTGSEFTDQGTMSLNNPANPNSFVGNTRGIDAFEAGSSSNARNVWWGSPSGPRTGQNPSGTGDSIVGLGAGGVLFKPFLTAAPDQANTPPVVRMVEPGLNWAGYSPPHDYLIESGTKYVIRWDVKDTDAVVRQRILYSPDSDYPDHFVVVADNLPGDQRSYEWSIPAPDPAINNLSQFLRVVAVDAAGQEGWDQTPLLIPSERITGEFNITTNLAGKTFYAGDPIPNVDWTGSVSDFPTIEPFVIYESDGAFQMGVYVNGHGEFVAQRFPAISTDRARLAVRVRNNGSDVKWFFASGYFSVRHDPRLGLVPPTVQLLTPAAGASFSAGATVPITWSASDDEKLYSFDVQASYDGGRTWHPVVRDLPATARSYDWQLPPNGSGLAGVRIRVVARDIRFQNNSSEGSFNSGGAQTPATAPTVTTAAAANAAGTSATLNGSVNPHGSATDAWFEWGTSSTLATYNTTSAQAIGSGNAGVATSQSIAGLSPNTLYYFRAAAANSGGTTRGGILSFRTAALPSLRVNSVTVTETNTGTNTTATFTVSLSAASTQTVTVNYQTANGTAAAPADYDQLALATLTFAPGQTTRTVSVTVRGDALNETNETFRLLLSSPTNATIAAGTGTCTITDNDPPPSITITNATVTEPDTGTVNAVFTVKLSAPSGRPVSVKHATANGTATAGTDYTAAALTTLTFSAGQTSKTVVVPVKGDLAKEANETFLLNLSEAVNATISDAQGLGTITNDD